jgi:hypothetical protein
MKVRNLLSIFFAIAYGFAMMIFGYQANGTSAGGQAMIVFGFFVSLVAATIIWAIWNLDISVRDRRSSAKLVESTEKRKRERLDSVLRDLSDADLLRLRQRLNDGTINEDALAEQLIGEDGELLYQEKRR